MERKTNILMIVLVIAVVVVVSSCESSFLKLNERHIISGHPSKLLSTVKIVSGTGNPKVGSWEVTVQLRTTLNSAIVGAPVSLWVSDSPTTISCPETNAEGQSTCRLASASGNKLISVSSASHPDFTLSTLLTSCDQSAGCRGGEVIVR